MTHKIKEHFGKEYVISYEGLWKERTAKVVGEFLRYGTKVDEKKSEALAENCFYQEKNGKNEKMTPQEKEKLLEALDPQYDIKKLRGMYNPSKDNIVYRKMEGEAYEPIKQEILNAELNHDFLTALVDNNKALKDRSSPIYSFVKGYYKATFQSAVNAEKLPLQTESIIKN